MAREKEVDDTSRVIGLTRAYHEGRLDWQGLVAEMTVFPWRPPYQDQKPPGEDPFDLDASGERILGNLAAGAAADTPFDLREAEDRGYLTRAERYQLLEIAWKATHPATA